MMGALLRTHGVGLNSGAVGKQGDDKDRRGSKLSVRTFSSGADISYRMLYPRTDYWGGIGDPG
jgi:hypothetical protein